MSVYDIFSHAVTVFFIFTLAQTHSPPNRQEFIKLSREEMVVFQCENCGQTIKKPKAEQHARSCRGFRGYVCIDCMKVFTGDSYKAHTSCISEAEKYQGALYDPTNVKKKIIVHYYLIFILK